MFRSSRLFGRPPAAEFSTFTVKTPGSSPVPISSSISPFTGLTSGLYGTQAHSATTTPVHDHSRRERMVEAEVLAHLIQAT